MKRYTDPTEDIQPAGLRALARRRNASIQSLASALAGLGVDWLKIARILRDAT